MARNNVFQDIYEVVNLIPKGRVTSYGAIARYLGLKSARLVGWAMSGLVEEKNVPAHRVVNSTGILTGASAFPNTNPMHKRLEEEGIDVRNNRIQNFKTVFWDPATEL